jgi:hypothetical protein
MARWCSPARGQPFTKTDWDNWRHRGFDRACVAVALYDARPYDLRPQERRT